MAKKLILVTGAALKLGEKMTELFIDYDDEEFEVVAIDTGDGLYVDHTINLLNDSRMRYLKSLYPRGFDFIVHCVDDPAPKQAYKACVDPLYSIEKYLLSEQTKLFTEVAVFNDTENKDVQTAMAIAHTHFIQMGKRMEKWDGKCQLLRPSDFHIESDEFKYDEFAEKVESYLAIS